MALAGYFPPHPRAPGLQEVVGLAVGWVGWKAQAARPTRRARRWQRSFTMAARDPLGVSTCTRNQTSPHNSPFPPSLLPSVPTSRAVEERSPTRKSSPQSRMIRGEAGYPGVCKSPSMPRSAEGAEVAEPPAAGRTAMLAALRRGKSLAPRTQACQKSIPRHRPKGRLVAAALFIHTK